MAYIEQCLVPEDSNKAGHWRQMGPHFFHWMVAKSDYCGWYTNRLPKTRGGARGRDERKLSSLYDRGPVCPAPGTLQTKRRRIDGLHQGQAGGCKGATVSVPLSCRDFGQQ